MVELMPARCVAILNAVDAGVLTPPEAEQSLAGLAWVKDPDRLLRMSHRLTLRIGLAQVPRRWPGAWQLALVGAGRLTGLRGPAELNQACLAADPDPILGLAGVALRHEGGIALTLAHEPAMGVGAVDAGGLDDEDHLVAVLRVRAAVRPLPPPTPAEAARHLSEALVRATTTLTSVATTDGRPEAAATVRLGEAYPTANQEFLDRAMTVLSIVAAARAQEHELPHSHAVTTRATALEPLRQAALDAVCSALSWPSHAMV